MRRLRSWLLCGLLLAAAGCATYTSKMGELRPQLARGDYDDALAKLDKEGGGKDLLLTELERGTLLHYAGRWAESNEAFESAEITADDLYTKSISEGALSLFTNDTAISYRARPYELAMIPYYRALNYVQLGERTDAVVEGRKASELLARFVDATLGGLDEDQISAFERTKNDGFLLYFSGMLYEWDGEVNDAFIAYRNAAFAYEANAGILDLQIPPALAGDLARTARWLGFRSDLDQVRASCPAVFAAAGDSATGARPADAGEVVLFVETGFVPTKVQQRADVPILESEKDKDVNHLAVMVSTRYGTMYRVPERANVAYWLSLAVPELSPPAPVTAGVRVSSDDGQHVRAARAQDLDALARVTFAAEQGKIVIKTAARALTKYLATRQAEKAGSVAGALANLFGAATETADTRAWLTLPRSIYVVRLTLPAGEHHLQLAVDDPKGQPGPQVDIGPVTVRAGGWTFLSQRIF